MTVISVLHIRLRPDAIPVGLETLSAALEATRSFEGCLGVEMVQDLKEPAHVVLVERWESEAQDEAYRRWRSTAEGASGLAPYQAGPSVVMTGRPV